MDQLEILKRVPMFSEIADDELQKIASLVIARHYAKHSIVFVEGEKLCTFFLIQSGIVKVTRTDHNGNEQVICLLPKGEMFPHVGFFEDILYPATAQTITDCELLAISMEGFKRLLDSHTGIAKSVMKMMNRRLLVMKQRLHSVMSGDVQRKVIMALLQLVEEYGVRRQEGVYLSIPLTHQDFANMLGLSRESVSRVLNQLKKEQLLETNRKGILIYNLEALENTLSPVPER